MQVSGLVLVAVQSSWESSKRKLLKVNVTGGPPSSGESTSHLIMKVDWPYWRPSSSQTNVRAMFRLWQAHW